VWLEWQLRGRVYVLSVVAWVGMMMAISLLTETSDTARSNQGIVFLLIPILAGAFYASCFGIVGDSVRPAPLTAFLATRPLSNSAVVVAKLRASALAAAAAWVFAVAALAGWWAFTGGHRDLSRLWERGVEFVGVPRMVGGCVLLAVGPVLVIWRMMVASLWTGLTGRTWVIIAQQAVAFGILLQGLYEWTTWNAYPDRRDRIFDALPWVAGTAVGLKLLAAGLALRALLRRGEVAPRVLARLLGLWLLTAATLFALLAWVVPSDQVPRYGLALGVVLFLPLARLAAAPLALAWNRHR
jgi:hypothetical protein